jgi:hypothetical protein
MVRVRFTDFLADTDRVRKLANNVVTDDFSDDEIKEYQYDIYSKIRSKTHKDDWSPSDRQFGNLELVEIYLTAAIIVEHYGMKTAPQLSAMQQWRDQAVIEMQEVLDNMPPEAEVDIDEDIFIISSLYASYPSTLLDNDLSGPYRSTNVSV